MHYARKLQQLQIYSSLLQSNHCYFQLANNQVRISSEYSFRDHHHHRHHRLLSSVTYCNDHDKKLAKRPDTKST